MGLETIGPGESNHGHGYNPCVIDFVKGYGEKEFPFVCCNTTCSLCWYLSLNLQALYY